MTKFGFAAVAAIAALLGIFGLSTTAQAYPDVRHSLTASQQVVFGGDSFTVTAAANVDCDWTLVWNDQASTGFGPRFETTYVAPQVSSVEELNLVGTCTYDTPGADAAEAARATWSDELTITVRPGAFGAAGPAGGRADLPGTGGPDRVVLLGGLVLVFAGATAVAVARRRAEETEFPVRTA